ncbi:MAG: hypothetical protein AB1416_01470, partial [Actinomycetota bacterium]
TSQLSGPAQAAAREAAPGPARPASARVLLVGDSVMLGASDALRATFGAGAVIDARVGRRFRDGIEVAVAHLRRLPAGTPVVVHLGNNYFVRPGEVDELMRRVPAGHPVLLVTVRVPLDWQDSVNTILRGAPARYRQATLVDWYAASGERGLLVDGAHTNDRGSRLYARVLADAVADASTDSDTSEGGT